MLGAALLALLAARARGENALALRFFDGCRQLRGGGGGCRAGSNATAVRFVSSRRACGKLLRFDAATVVTVRDTDARRCSLETMYLKLVRGPHVQAVLLARGDGVAPGALYYVHDGARGALTRHWGVPCLEISAAFARRLRRNGTAPESLPCSAGPLSNAWRASATWVALDRAVLTVLALAACALALHAQRVERRRLRREFLRRDGASPDSATTAGDVVLAVEAWATGLLAGLLAAGLWATSAALPEAVSALAWTAFAAPGAFTLVLLGLEAAGAADDAADGEPHDRPRGRLSLRGATAVSAAAALPEVVVSVLFAARRVPELAIVRCLFGYAALEWLAVHAFAAARRRARAPLALVCAAASVRLAGAAAVLAAVAPEARLAGLFVATCGRLASSAAKVACCRAARRRAEVKVAPKLVALSLVTTHGARDGTAAGGRADDSFAGLRRLIGRARGRAAAAAAADEAHDAELAAAPGRKEAGVRSAVGPRAQAGGRHSFCRSSYEGPPPPPLLQRMRRRSSDFRAVIMRWTANGDDARNGRLRRRSLSTDAEAPRVLQLGSARLDKPTLASIDEAPAAASDASVASTEAPDAGGARPRARTWSPRESLPLRLWRGLEALGGPADEVQPFSMAPLTPHAVSVAARPPGRVHRDAGRASHRDYNKLASRMAVDSFEASFFVLDSETGLRKWAMASKGNWSDTDARLALEAPVENLLASSSQERPELTRGWWRDRPVGSRLIVHKLDWSTDTGRGSDADADAQAGRKFYRATLEKISTSELLVTLQDISQSIYEWSRVVALMADEMKRGQEARERRAESQLRAYVHHDIGNLLMGLCGIQLMIEDAKAAGAAPDDDVCSLLDLHLQTGREMLDSMVGITKLSDPAYLPPVESFEMEDLLEEVATLVRQRAAPGVEIVVTCDGVANVVASRHYIKMVLFNLGGNAVKFTERGRITFSAAKVTARKCVVVVEDTGRGIPSDKLEKIRGLDGLALSAGRKGVGLAFVMQVCRKLFGAAPDIESSVGTGTRVSFVMEHSAPAPEATRGRAAITADDASQGPGETPFRADDPRPRACLVVDDYELNRRVLSNLLRSVLRPEGAWTIDEAPNGEAALALAATRHFDIVTLDFNMQSSGGTLTGAETATKLAALAAPPEVMIGITGSSAHDVERRQLLSAGCRYVWGKPPPGSAEASELLFGLVKKASRTRGLFSRQDSTPRVALICDDDAFIRTALTRMLRRILSENWSVITVTNGEEALANNSSLEADFILMDFHLAKSGGKLNGAETAARLIERRPGAIIVGITANAAPGDEEPKKLIDAGCLEVFGKPILSSALENVIFATESEIQAGLPACLGGAPLPRCLFADGAL
ncbi:hypothetical protein M885DRAFT_540916 [Pelagophyceae sp. CCMP2097]|nr:hypothetical protein M885DRAFT_540916 [Pelagophyceae sp. CCMP2097]